MTASNVPEVLAERLRTVEERIAGACRRSGRPRGDVSLVAVTKIVSAEVAVELHRLGVMDLGENRPQELWAKAALLPKTVRWHMIGHLQRNKLERTLPLVHMVHSVDSVRLLEALEQEGARQSRAVDALLEVNASQEATKHGFPPAEVPSLLPRLIALQWVRVRGLMTMAAPQSDQQRCRSSFVELRHLRDRLRGELPPPHDCGHLSMGMSNDFEVAIEEGATLVRLGTVLFDGLA